MEIYAEWIFIINFIVSFLCFKISSVSFGISNKKVIASSVIAGVCAVISVAMDISHIYVVWYLIISIFLFGKNTRGYIMLFIIMACTYSIIIFLITITQSNTLIQIYNGIFYINVSEKVFVCVFTVAILFTMLVSRVWRITANKTIYPIIIEKNKKRIVANALYDSGNLLMEKRTGKKVILVEKTVLTKLDLDNILVTEKPIIIPYKSFENSGVILGFSADKIIVNNKEIKNAIIGISEKGFDGNCNALIGGM